jgi:hypothetical protein
LLDLLLAEREGSIPNAGYMAKALKNVWDWQQKMTLLFVLCVHYNMTSLTFQVTEKVFLSVCPFLRFIVKCYRSIFSLESFIHFVICLTTGPKPFPKQALHIVRSSASSFKWEYPLLSLRSSSSFLLLLPRLPVTSIPLFYLSFNNPL